MFTISVIFFYRDLKKTLEDDIKKIEDKKIIEKSIEEIKKIEENSKKLENALDKRSGI